MRPDRLVVGEVRDAEALDLLLALNTGVPGAATIHANSAREALGKLAALPLLAGRNIDSAFVLPAVAASVDLVVHCERDADGPPPRRRDRRADRRRRIGAIDARTVYRCGRAMTFVWGAVLAAGLLLTLSPWLWPAGAARADRDAHGPARPAARVGGARRGCRRRPSCSSR